MAYFDNSDSFSYPEKIVLGYAEELCCELSTKVIAQLKSMTEGLQSGGDSGLVNIWEEICVQLQSDYSAMWDLYDETVCDLVERAVLCLSQYAMAALQYSIDFKESEHGYEYDLDEIVNNIVHRIYEEATADRSARVTAFLENEGAI